MHVCPSKCVYVYNCTRMFSGACNGLFVTSVDIPTFDLGAIVVMLYKSNRRSKSIEKTVDCIF